MVVQKLIIFALKKGLWLHGRLGKLKGCSALRMEMITAALSTDAPVTRMFSSTTCIGWWSLTSHHIQYAAKPQDKAS
jgi:hypothetical protein